MPLTSLGDRTLRLHRPSMRAACLVLCWAVALPLLSEVTLRWKYFRFLPTPSIGSGHPQFDQKWARLERLAHRPGGVNGFFMGSSLVNLGIDPEVFSTAIQARLHRDARCFNFGLKGVTETTAAKLADVFTGLYRPRIIIYGLSIGDLADETGESTERRLLVNPWVRYRLGEPNLDGWLIDHSVAFRAYLGLRSALDPLPTRHNWQRQPKISNWGHGRSRKIWIGETDGSNLNGRNRDHAAEILARFEVSPRHLAALEQLLALRSKTQVVLVEMPVHPSTIALFGKGWADYLEGRAAVDDLAKRYRTSFWHADMAPAIDPTGWHDRYHLNDAGAAVFSRWLGEQVAAAIARGELSDFTRTEQ
jgi:hypothetical protein